MDSDRILEILEDGGWYLHDARKTYVCGICGTKVTSTSGIQKTWADTAAEISHPQRRDIRICPDCQFATTFHGLRQFPEPLVGERFNARSLSGDAQLVVALYDEARFALSRSGSSCPVLILRKLLMHIAVEQGAKPGESFLNYCDYLKDQNIVAKPQHAIVDRIRKAGNEENHEIRRATEDEAADLLDLVTVLIKCIYFMP